MYAFFKRTFDIFFSAIMLVLLSPVLLVTAILVRIKLGGPVIFVNYRPGKGGKVFALYKFRSMSNARDENGDLLPDDQRFTKFGKLLRATSLDELPQLWNILKGDMSLIGPRPRLIKDALYYGIEGNEVYSLAVRPGLTGRSQVYGRNDNTWAKIFEHDEYYVKHMGFAQDFKIFFRTFYVVLARKSIEKEEFKYYNDYCYAKGIIDNEEYKRGLAQHKEMEKNCALGIKQYVKVQGTIPTIGKKKAAKANAVYDDDDKVEIIN